MRNLESKWLEDFLTLVELRNFSQAAEARNLSQPAFSRRIRSLEFAVGAELIDRSASPMQLTPQGRLFHAQARNMLSQIESNLNELSGINDAGNTYIRISAAHSLAISIFPQVLQSLAERRQQFMCTVDVVDVDKARDNLREGESDFILSFHEEEFFQKPYLYQKWSDDELIPVCSALPDGQPSVSLTGHDIPLLTYTHTSYFGRLVNRKIAQLPGYEFNIVFMSSMALILKRMALEGHGIAWLPKFSILDDLKNGSLVVVPLVSNNSKIPPSIPLEICFYRSETRLNATAEAFWKALEQDENHIRDADQPL
jgi:DNA-binding transcriptional LysR family regulator